jgi:TorA maturation chaperone TorD
VADPAALVPVARLFARLLLEELDSGTLQALREAGSAEALLALGVALPAERELQALASEYCATFLRPAEGLPPIQSLWSEGRYDGEAAASARAFAAAAGREPARGARGAPPDHLGCLLALWAELVEEDPQLAARLAQAHLAWAPAALAPLARRSGFYGQLAGATGQLVRLILG